MWAAFIGDPYYIWYEPNTLKISVLPGTCATSQRTKEFDDSGMLRTHELSDLGHQDLISPSAEQLLIAVIQ